MLRPTGNEMAAPNEDEPMPEVEITSWPDAAVRIAVIIVVGLIMAKLLDIIGKSINKR